MFWLTEVLIFAAEIHPDNIIDSDEPVKVDEIILGIAHDEVRQLYTSIKLAEIEFNSLLDEAKGLSGVERKKKSKEMFQASGRIEVLEVILKKELRRRFNMTWGHIEIRKGFQVVWCKHSSHRHNREDM